MLRGAKVSGCKRRSFRCKYTRTYAVLRPLAAQSARTGGNRAGYQKERPNALCGFTRLQNITYLSEKALNREASFAGNATPSIERNAAYTEG